MYGVSKNKYRSFYNLKYMSGVYICGIVGQFVS